MLEAPPDHLAVLSLVIEMAAGGDGLPDCWTPGPSAPGLIQAPQGNSRPMGSRSAQASKVAQSSHDVEGPSAGSAGSIMNNMQGIMGARPAFSTPAMTPEEAQSPIWPSSMAMAIT